MFGTTSRSNVWREMLDDLSETFELPATKNILPLLLYKVIFLSFFQEKGLFFNEKGETLDLLRIIELFSANDLSFCTGLLFTKDDDSTAVIKLEKAGIYAPPLTFRILNSLRAHESCLASPVNSEMRKIVGEKLSNDLFSKLIQVLNKKHKETVNDPEILSFLFDLLQRDGTDFSRKIEKGVFFTPYSIARIMAKKSIEELVLVRARELLKKYWLSFDDLIDRANTDQLKKILEKVIKPLTVLDPAVGSGELLAASGKVLLDIQVKIASLLAIKVSSLEVVRKIIRENLFGVDLLPGAGQACCQRLFLLLASQTDSLKDIESRDYPESLTIKTGNSLIGYSFDRSTEGKITGKKSDFHYFEHVQELLGTSFTLEALKRLAPFHWDQEFPLIGAAGGFDIIISNPPWGSRAKGTKTTSSEKKLLKKFYPAWGSNTYGAFIERFLSSGNVLRAGGIGCFIVPDTLTTIRTFSSLRGKMLEKTIQEIILLGDGVFTDAPAMGSLIIRITNRTPGETHSVTVLKGLNATNNEKQSSSSLPSTYSIQQKVWRQLKGNRFIHGVSPSILKFFMKDSSINTICPLLGVVRQGLATGDNTRFIKPLKGIPLDQIGTKTLEFREGGKKWAKIALGRHIRPYRLDIEKAVFWENNGETIRKQRHKLTGRPKARTQNERYYFKGGGISFKGLGKGNFCAAPLPEDCIFSHTAHTVFLHEPKSYTSDFLLGYLNGFIGRFFVDRCINTGKHVEVNDVAELPVIIPEKENMTRVSELVREAIEASSEERINDLERIQGELDQLILEVFGLFPEDFEECYSIQLADLVND